MVQGTHQVFVVSGYEFDASKTYSLVVTPKPELPLGTFSGRSAFFAEFKRRISDTEYEFETKGGYFANDETPVYPGALCAAGYKEGAINLTDPDEMDIHVEYSFVG